MIDHIVYLEDAHNTSKGSEYTSVLLNKAVVDKSLGSIHGAKDKGRFLVCQHGKSPIYINESKVQKLSITLSPHCNKNNVYLETQAHICMYKNMYR